MVNVLRKDENEARKHRTENLIEMAPFVEEGYVKVKHVFNNLTIKKRGNF